MAGSQRSFVQVTRHHLVNPAALAYLALVVAVLVRTGVDALFVEHQDASLAGIWAFVVTGPTSWLFLMLPGGLPWAGVVVGALVQAAVLGAAYHRLSGRLHHHRTRPNGA
ncbi:SCO4225 family membrane protein [Streptomyces chartreusis]|uniref:SCO4225 family membrane protein n=1 Tax=Streptomyces chartreusis TaxID=1969 RepID=UPI0035D65318